LDPAAPVPVLEPFVRPQLCAIDFAGAGGVPGVPGVSGAPGTGGGPEAG
jgi:hypothetical protein